MEKSHLFRSMAGIDHWMVTEGNMTRFAISADVAPLLEQNKRMQTHNDGYSPSREFRRVASIPDAIGYKWLHEEGWWYRDASFDSDVARKLVAKLNSSDYRYLRTAEGHVSVSNGQMR